MNQQIHTGRAVQAVSGNQTQSMQQAGKLGLCFFFLVESYPSLVVKQHFQEEERLEENTDLPWGEGFSPISAVQLRGILPVSLIMYTTGDFAKGWKEGATGAGRRLR